MRRSVVLQLPEMRYRTQGTTTTTTTRRATYHKSAFPQFSRLPSPSRATRSRIQLTSLPSERNVTETSHIIGY